MAFSVSLCRDASPIMRIKSLTAFELPVVLKRPVRHASHVRTKNDTLLIRCELHDGSVGWGEGLPRTYVTGESISSVWRHLQTTSFAQLADAGFDSPLTAVSTFDAFSLADVAADAGVVVRECFGNSVRCALELALLDAFCRSADMPIGTLLEQLPQAKKIRHCVDQVQYSGVVTSSGSTIGQWRSALKMKLFGFRHVKAKVGTQNIDDRLFLGRVRRMIGTNVDLRLDANEAWHSDDVIRKMEPLLPFQISSLEQPVPYDQTSALADIRRELPVPVMLDESLCCMEDAERAIADETCDLFNLRISKCGGIVRCVQLADLAETHGLGYQLGCQVGETGLLSAAGRHFACTIGGCRYLEGSYDRFVVQDAMTKENLTFRYGGKADRLTKPGLGVTVDEAKIRSKFVRTETLI